MTIKCNTGPYFYGDLVQNEDLEKIAGQRKKKYEEIAISRSELESYLSENWEFKRQLTNKIILKKEIEPDEFFENEVWLLFKNMGFKEMNKDRNFKIQAGSISKQIDVFAKDDDNIFIIECKTGSSSLRKDIHEILNLRRGIIESIKKHYKKSFRFSFLLVTKNISWNKKDEELASTSENLGFFFWKEQDLEAYNNLVEQLGENAKFQMFSILFFGKKTFSLQDIEVPAIYGGKGNKKYYVFIIQPGKLAQIAYVHRREKSNPEEISGTYQRMVKGNRLKKIHEFIENKGGFFPNNIIINFTKKPTFDRKSEVGDIVYGILKFPPYYGSAWVIDGQHRLYGYSKSEKKWTDKIPVVAFESLKVKDQANIFVEINKEQQSVSSNLLWDLYPDIYEGSEDEGQQILRTISLIAKRLNSDQESSLHNHIAIPSLPKGDIKVSNLTLANICDGIEENGLINKDEALLFENNYENTIKFASERIKAYFNFLAESFPEDWEKGEHGLLRTNVGIRIFIIILRQFIKYLKYKGLEEVYFKKDLCEFKSKTKEILDPILTELKEMSESKRSDIRRATGKGPIVESAQKLVWNLKEKFNFGIELWNKGGWTPSIPDEDSDERIKELVEDTEKKVRSFIIDELQKIHKESWYKIGVPKGVKDYIDGIIGKDISRAPYKKEKLLALPAEEKIICCSPSHLKEIIINNANWDQFKNTFANDKECVSVQFKFFESLRNKVKAHPERDKEIFLDEIEKKLGYWGMRWIRRCIGLDIEEIVELE